MVFRCDLETCSYGQYQQDPHVHSLVDLRRYLHQDVANIENRQQCGELRTF